MKQNGRECLFPKRMLLGDQTHGGEYLGAIEVYVQSWAKVSGTTRYFRALPPEMVGCAA